MYFLIYESNFFRVIHLEESKTFPQHFYNNSVEIVHILHAQNGAEIGQCDQWTTDLQSDSIHFFGYSAPKMIKVTMEVSIDGKRTRCHFFYIRN